MGVAQIAHARYVDAIIKNKIKLMIKYDVCATAQGNLPPQQPPSSVPPDVPSDLLQVSAGHSTCHGRFSADRQDTSSHLCTYKCTGESMGVYTIGIK